MLPPLSKMCHKINKNSPNIQRIRGEGSWRIMVPETYGVAYRTDAEFVPHVHYNDLWCRELAPCAPA